MRRALAALGMLAAALSIALAQAPRRLPEVEIVNDDRPRADLALAFDLPRGLPGELLQLRDDAGAVLPLQITTDRRAALVLPRLDARERRRFTLEPALNRRLMAVAEAVRRDDSVELKVDRRPLLVYRGEKTPLPSADVPPVLQRGGYVHPVMTPSGRIVTGDYPANHRHHHGIWSAWAGTTFEGRHPDFWNMGSGTGTVEFESIPATWSGTVHAGLRARHRYMDLQTKPATTAVNEVWDLTAYAVGRGTPGYRVFDLVLRHEVTAGAALQLEKYLYGPLGVRGPDAWDGAGRMQFLTSEGRTRADGHATRARWCSMGGLVGGRPAGLAILDHPDNVRHPQAMRLHPTEPFFSFAPVQLGPLPLHASQVLTLHYRFIVFDGAPNAPLIERLWHDFAHPPKIAVR